MYIEIELTTSSSGNRIAASLEVMPEETNIPELPLKVCICGSPCKRIRCNCYTGPSLIVTD